MHRPIRAVAVMLLAAALIVVAGCAKKEETPKLQPKIAPPAIGKAGTLRAGVDLSTPPFAGEDGGQKAGIDVDVAAAVAEKLGLSVTYVNVAPSEVATALAEGKVDIALSVPIAAADLTRVGIAGTYVVDGPAVWVARSAETSGQPPLTLDTLPAGQVAVQEGSEAYWILKAERGDESISAKESLSQALAAVDGGETPMAAGSVVVGSYLVKDLPKLAFAGQIGPASPLGVATAIDNAKLADAVRSALDELAADGVLDSIQKKWIGTLPKLDTADSSADDGKTAP